MILPGPLQEQTRRRLAEGTLLQTLRNNPPPGVTLRTDAELAETLEAALREHDAAQDLHVFGYGSLMWNPAMDAMHVGIARVPGWHRRFCLRLLFGRGTAHEPGAMLALDRGGSCKGLLFRIEASKVRAEAQLLWQREMLAGSYEARWVAAHIGGHTVRALTFVVNRHCGRYIAGRTDEDVAHLIRTGNGALGSSRAYFDATVETLDELGIRDRRIQSLQHAIRLADQQTGA